MQWLRFCLTNTPIHVQTCLSNTPTVKISIKYVKQSCILSNKLTNNWSFMRRLKHLQGAIKSPPNRNDITIRKLYIDIISINRLRISLAHDINVPTMLFKKKTKIVFYLFETWRNQTRFHWTNLYLLGRSCKLSETLCIWFLFLARYRICSSKNVVIITKYSFYFRFNYGTPCIIWPQYNFANYAKSESILQIRIKR